MDVPGRHPIFIGAPRGSLDPVLTSDSTYTTRGECVRTSRLRRLLGSDPIPDRLAAQVGLGTLVRGRARRAGFALALLICMYAAEFPQVPG